MKFFNRRFSALSAAKPSRLFSAPSEGCLLATEGDYRAYVEKLREINELSAYKCRVLADEEQPDEQDFGGYGDMITPAGRTALVAVNGFLSSEDHWLLRLFGVTSYPAVVNALSAVARSGEFDSAVMVFDSPGGSVPGADEAAAQIKALDANFPVYAYNAAQMSSGAYWLASGARRIGSSRLAGAGSIGVITVHEENSKALEKHGFKATVLSIGQHKADGNPYEPLSASAKSEILRNMQQVFDVFASTVSVNRGLSVAAITAQQGREYMGQAALSAGLVDSIGGYEAFVQAVIDETAQPTGLGRSQEFVMDREVMGGMPAKTSPSDETVAAQGGKPAAPEYDPAIGGQLVGGPAGDPAEKSALPADGDGSAVAVKYDANKPDPAQSDATADSPGQPTSAGGSEPSARSDLELSARAWRASLDDAHDAYAELAAKHGQLKRDYAAVVNERNAACDENGGLRAIAAYSLSRLEIALGATPSPVEAMSNTALIETHRRLYGACAQRFPVEAKAAVPIENNLHNEQNEINKLDDTIGYDIKARKRAVSFGQQDTDHG